MKTFLIVFCTFTLIATFTIFAYNSDKGPAKQKDGISELPNPSNDSLSKRGKYLLSQFPYNEQDLKAIAVYLSNK
jgi:hypothetical protein